ncbi:MAG: PilZ domain-containing protein [Pseudomonadota bacterium]|jgi:hypothetical protein|nr:PilZ domain-containing protein [Xanthomonadaceae bacterium]MDE2249259.1 PilZ domain-containing protein [Xanthomonadaceae bacterium]MDE3210042.1 PilZ domain-containing protein [Pseudomonadota bacterium]
MTPAPRVRTGQERRRANRKPVDFDATVIDTIAEQPFGRIGNLSATGMLLISATPPRQEAVYQLRLPLPESGGAQRRIDVGVQEQWHEQTASADVIWAGYRIIAISDPDAERLKEWLAQPG